MEVPDARVVSIAAACSHRLALKRRWIAWSERLVLPLRRYSSISRPIGVIRSGKRRPWTCRPRDCRLAISLPHCVDLPALSRPSKTMNLPRRGFAAEDMLLRLRELRFRYDLSLRIFSHILQISLISVSSL